jgi:hypothetical protein
MSEIILTDEQRDNLDMLTSMYVEALDEFNTSEAKKNAYNLTIKETLNEFGIKSYKSSNGYNLSMTSRPNIKWDEDMLIKVCKQKNIDGLVKTKEYVDMDVLESAIYHGDILPEDISNCRIVKPDVVTLRCTQSKKQQLNE